MHFCEDKGKSIQQSMLDPVVLAQLAELDFQNGAIRMGGSAVGPYTSGGADLSPVSVEVGIGVRKCVGHQPTSRYRHRCGGYPIGAGRTQGRNKLCTHQQCPSFPNPTRS